MLRSNKPRVLGLVSISAATSVSSSLSRAERSSRPGGAVLGRPAGMRSAAPARGIAVARRVDARRPGRDRSHSNGSGGIAGVIAVSYTHLRAHETVLDLVC